MNTNWKTTLTGIVAGIVAILGELCDLIGISAANLGTDGTFQLDKVAMALGLMGIGKFAGDAQKTEGKGSGPITVPLLILLGLLAFSINARSQEVVPAKAFNAGEFQVELFGQVVTPDLDSERTGYGFGLSYYITESLGAGVRTHFDELSGHTFESVSPRLLWRVPVGGKHALYAFAQGTRVFHDRTVWTVEAGPGYEWRPIEHVGLYAEIGMRKEIAGADRSTDTFGTGEAGLRFTW